MKKIATLFICLLIGGCMTLPKSASELKNSSSSTREFCHHQSPSDTFTFLSEKMKSCYTRQGSAYFPESLNPFLELEKFNDDKFQMAVGMNNPGIPKTYTMDVDLTLGSDDCETHVKVYALNSMWLSHADKVGEWLQGDNDDCAW
ncbi:MAG: hypothetical protein ABFS24_15365 [Pseudomonadota bacterium]